MGSTGGAGTGPGSGEGGTTRPKEPTPVTPATGPQRASAYPPLGDEQIDLVRRLLPPVRPPVEDEVPLRSVA